MSFSQESCFQPSTPKWFCCVAWRSILLKHIGVITKSLLDPLEHFTNIFATLILFAVEEHRQHSVAIGGDKPKQYYAYLSSSCMVAWPSRLSCIPLSWYFAHMFLTLMLRMSVIFVMVISAFLSPQFPDFGIIRTSYLHCYWLYVCAKGLNGFDWL